MTTEPLYWHFLAADRRMTHTGELVEAGKTYRIEDKPALCKRGLHASARALDALKYAPGPVVCLVTLGGIIIHGDDKSVAQTRTVLAIADATAVLHEFACRCAWQALALVEEPDPRSIEAIAMKRRWLRGETTNDELAAARAAARVVAQDAAQATTRAAAWAATWAAWDVAWDAARAAARTAAWAAAWDAAQDAAWTVAQDAAWVTWDAARAAVWAAQDAAWDAAQDAQNEQLETMLRVELGNEKETR